MKIKIVLSLIIWSIILGGSALAETRVYRQSKDVTVQEKGQVIQSEDKDDLFECTYEIDRAEKTITRTNVRRLDDPDGRQDQTVYNIQQELDLVGSEAGNGGKVLVAVREDGGEILELGRRFAFTMRLSPFSMVITGVYRRVFDHDQGHHR